MQEHKDGKTEAKRAAHVFEHSITMATLEHTSVETKLDHLFEHSITTT
jgi:hypothetical protein